MRTRLLSSALAVLALAAASPADAAERWRELTASYPLAAGQELRLELASGEIDLEATDGSTVEVEVTLECRWGDDAECRRLLDRLSVESRDNERRRTVWLAGESSWRRAKLDVRATVRAPRGAVLDVDLGVGELDAEGFTGDLTVDLGVGELTVRAPAAAVRSVALDVGVGEAEILGGDGRVEGRRSLLVGSEVYWEEGRGKARIRGDVGVGEATVWLD